GPLPPRLRECLRRAPLSELGGAPGRQAGLGLPGGGPGSLARGPVLLPTAVPVAATRRPGADELLCGYPRRLVCRPGTRPASRPRASHGLDRWASRADGRIADSAAPGLDSYHDQPTVRAVPWDGGVAGHDGHGGLPRAAPGAGRRAPELLQPGQGL